MANNAGFQRAAPLFAALLQVSQAAPPNQATLVEAAPAPALVQGPADDPIVEDAEQPRYCSICRSNGGDCRLPCGHIFHERCIRPWLISDSSCASPYCNSFFVPDDIQNLP